MADPIHHKRHGEHIIEINTRPSKYEEVEFPLWGIQGRADLKGVPFSIGGCLLTRPLVMGGDAHAHDFDQLLFFLGADARDVRSFDAEIEMFLGDRFERLDYAACIHVPAGLLHGPVVVKRVGKPVFYMDVTLDPSESDRPPSSYQLPSPER